MIPNYDQEIERMYHPENFEPEYIGEEEEGEEVEELCSKSQEE